MRKTILFAATLLMTVLPYTQAEQSVTAKTKEATVFLSGAELKQEAVMTLRQGENEVRVEGLAPNIDRQSLRIALGGQVVLTSFDYTTDYLSRPATGQRVKLLEDSLQHFTKQKEQLQSEVATTDEMLKLLQTGMQTALTPAEQTLTTEAIEKNLTYFRTRQNQLKAERNRLQQQAKAAEERAADYKRQLQEEQKGGKKRCGVVTLRLNSTKAGQCTTVLTYYTPSASWTPYYDMNIQSQTEPVSLTMKARVRQNTGIDWQKARLTLSTGQPARQHDAPKLSTWYLRTREPYHTGNHSGKAKSAARVMAYEDAAPMPMEEPMMMREMAVEEVSEENASVAAYVEAEEQTLSRDYKINLPYTIEGNGKEQTIVLIEHKAQTADTKYTYLTVPKTDGGTYLTLDLSNWQQWGLLNGEVNITNNNVFYGQSRINTETTGGTLSLTIGEDKQIAVKREMLQDYSQTKTVGSNKTTTRAYKITVTNNKSQDITVRLQEPYPVSTDKNISIELTEETTTATDNDKDHGILTYEIPVKAGHTETVTVGYQVKYPKEKVINL